MNIEETCLSFLDTDYSYEIAKRMETHKTNPALGYRTAGSRAERATGDILFEEMQNIGLSEVTKDTFRLDGWEFEKAILKFIAPDGQEHICQMGGYQTDFVTDGFQAYELVYLGKGTASDYEGVDVRGKLVMVEMNQRDEWWISFPVYQAYLKGAAALIAVQTQGYGEVDATALNAQDIAGPEFAPAFSLSQADAVLLKSMMFEKASGEEKNHSAYDSDVHSVTVWLDASSKVMPDVISANITGKIPGRETDSMILLSAHYDSYFDGFQDDNAAVALMLGIARALIKGGYQPAHTLVFCAMAAEEWGVIDSKYDWSTGAYNQVFRIHPEWQGKVIANLNFELPAHAHNTRDAVRCTYEYADFMQKFVDTLDVPGEAFPDGMTVLYPIETWSDDFSMAIAGIPSMVNDFSAGPFMQNYYHSQYDNQDLYQEPVYRFHHECYLKLVLEMDKLVLPPFDFGKMLRAAADSVNERMCAAAGCTGKELTALLKHAAALADEIYEKISQINGDYLKLKLPDERLAFRKRQESTAAALYHIFRKTQDYFVRLNWHDEVIFPEEAVQRNLHELQSALKSLKAGDVRQALAALYQVDNNMYAFLFDEEVYYHFTEYILHQPKERLMWGYGRIVHHENLYGIVQKLKSRLQEPAPMLDEDIRRLDAAFRRQKSCLRDDIRYMTDAAEKIIQLLTELDI